MSFESEIGIILLAAGSSSRMGQQKLLFKYRGKTLLDRAIEAGLSSSASRLVVVTGSGREETEALSDAHGVQSVFNEEWEKGLGSSLKRGLRDMLKSSPGLSAVIVAVCDQPHLSAGILDGLIRTYRNTGKPIVASSYGETVGVPVLYDKTYFDALLDLPDDQGAKPYLLDNAGPGTIASIHFPGGEIDIDTREDLKFYDT